MLDIKKNKNINIISISNIENLLSTLPKTHTLILKNNGFFVCGIYYKENDWRFMFNDYAIFSLNSENQRGIVGDWDRQLKAYSNDGMFDYLIFDNMENMCYEIRNNILSSCINSLMNPKFMIGDKEYESNLPKIIPEVEKDLGKVVDFGHDTKGILVGLSSTLEDYYYVFITSDDELHFSSCVGGFTTQGGIPQKFKHLVKEPSKMSEIMFKHFGDPLCTEICLISI